MPVMSDYLENKIIDHLFRAQTFAAPTTLWIGLYTVMPTDAGGGTEVSTSGTGYARVSVTNSLANWAGTQSAASTTASSGSSGITSNNANITFGTPTANWGTIVGFGIFDAATAGNLMFYGWMSPSKSVLSGNPAPRFSAGALIVEID